MRALIAILASGCAAGAPVQAVPEREDPAARPAIDEQTAEFEIEWAGQPVGVARERIERRAGGYRLTRSETWVVSRSGQVVSGALALTIDTDAALVARAIEVKGGAGGRGRAVREGAVWRVELEGEPPREVGGEAVPAELVPYLLARRGDDRFRGAVLLAGLGFAVAEMTVEPAGEGRRLVHLAAAPGTSTASVRLRADGTVDAVTGPALSLHRRRRARMPGAPADLVALSTLPVDGAGRDERTVAWPPPPLAVPDPPPSTRIHALAADITTRASDRVHEIESLARAVADELEADLAAGPLVGPDELLSRGRGDCVAHAVLFSALARARGFTVRLVTGFRVDPRAGLVRHAWALVDVDGRPLVVDPTEGEAPPAAGRHIPLAVHGSAAAEIALAAELAYPNPRVHPN